jgi:phage regulator Rha-like protein
MKTDLVFTKKNEVFTNSKILAEKLSGAKDQHRNVMITIKELIEKAGFKKSHSRGNASEQLFTYTHSSGAIILDSTFKVRGRTFPCFEMNEQGYLYIMMQLGRYKNALTIQGLFIEAFTLMKNALNNQANLSWQTKRTNGKVTRREETDVIKEFVEYATAQGSKSANMYYSNITRMTNKSLELLIEVKDGKPIRDLATVTELGFIQVVDHRAGQAIADAMSKGYPYKEVYIYAKKEVQTFIDSLIYKQIDSRKLIA